MDNKKRIGDIVRHYREELGLTQTELARLSRVKREYISSIELGRIGVIGPKTFASLHRVLKFPTWELMGAIGYPLDEKHADILPSLAQLLEAMPEDQQYAVLGVVRAMGKGMDTLTRA